MNRIFTRTNVVLALAGTFAALALTAAACADTSGAATGTATSVPPQTATVIVHDPAEPRPSSTPTTNPNDKHLTSPRVLWMSTTHAGAGAITVQVETDVPTTAKISVSTGHAGDGAQLPGPESDTTLSTHHTISIGTGGSRVLVEAEVRDANGRKANADLTSGAPANFWGVGDNAPRLTLAANRAAMADWTNLKGLPGPARAGAVIVLSKTAGCTTAQACMPAPAASFDQDDANNSADGAYETHHISFSFPDKTHDYLVVFEGNPAADGSFPQFYQFDVPASSIK